MPLASPDLHRPSWHVTVPRGWLNDPLGVTWAGERYHLFHQLVPDGVEWSPRCAWGQLDGPDLVHWEHPRVALAPADAGEDADVDHGCWSGSVAVDDGRPTIVYTSADAADLHRGRIALAHGDAGFGGWTKAGVVVPGPPPSLDVAVFRDPFVWPVDGGWRMVVGAGLGDGSGAALQYSGPDLRTWRFDGVLAERPGDRTDGTWTGTAWECPQLVELDGAWLLVVSVWADQVTHNVACAVGDYDGRRFTPRSWHRFAHGDSLYATTLFRDRAGRVCAISWSRDAGPAGDRTWAGALSAPVVLERRGDRVLARPHPDVDALRAGPAVDVPPGRLDGPAVLGPVGPSADLEVSARLLDPSAALDLVLEQAGRAVLGVAVRGDDVTLARPGHDDEHVPLGAGPDGAVEVRVLLDGGLAEVFTPAGFGAVRIDPAAREGRWRVVPRGTLELGAARCERLGALQRT